MRPYSFAMVITSVIASVCAILHAESVQGEEQVPSAFTSEIAKTLIPAAAGVPKAVFDELAESATPPDPANFVDFPLTMMFIMMRPDADPGAHLRMIGGENPSPSKLVRALEGIGDPGPLPYATVIHRRYITEVTIVASNEVAAFGTVRFEAIGVYIGDVDFVARTHEGAWRIEEFSLPRSNLGTKLTDDGWRQTKGPSDPRPGDPAIPISPDK